MKRVLWLLQPKYIKYLILVLICVVLSFMNKKFLTMPNILNIFRQTAVLAVLSIGMTFVIITKGIDLSVAGVMSLSGCVCALLLNKGVPVWQAMLLTMLLGTFFGCINGALVAFIGLPPFVATYGVKFIADGLALVLMGGSILYGFPQAFRFLGTGFFRIHKGGELNVFGLFSVNMPRIDIPMLVIAMVAIAIVFYIVLAHTKLGRQVFCVGANAAASFYSGVRTRAVLLFAFGLCGTFAAVGGMLQTARMNAAQAGMGDPFQMLTVASVVMGGTSMSGGEGGIPGTIVGSLILTLIVNGMNLVEIPSLAQPLITGAVIIGAVAMDIQMKKMNLSGKTPVLKGA